MEIVRSNQTVDEEMLWFIDTYYLRLYLERDKLETAEETLDGLYRFYGRKNELFSKRGLNTTKRMADLYRKRGDDEQELYWLDQNRMINDSIFSLSDQNVIFTLNKMMEAELDRKNDERVEEIAYSILDRRNNGTWERTIKNGNRSADMLRYAQTWSRYLEYRIKEKGEKD